MPKVAIVGRDGSMSQMFIRNGWEVVDDFDKADFLQFTGGADVDPMLYQQPKNPSTYSDPARDSRESHIYWSYVGQKGMLGICRGGQFLNVMNGGEMWQNVDRHAIGGTHPALDVETNEWVEVTSTHHQMMLPAEDGHVLVTARLTTMKEDGYDMYHSKHTTPEGSDIESVLYSDTKTLCFQPHPEYCTVDDPCQRLYFNLIKRHLMN